MTSYAISLGNLSVIAGPMFSGKTALLIEMVARHPPETAIVLKPAMDTRFSASEVVSRERGRVGAMPISSWPDIADATNVVFIDEIQFMDALHYRGDIVSDIEGTLRRGVDVVVCGLDTDYIGNLFEVTARLLTIANFVHRLTAQCACCGAPAGKTIRYDENRREERIVGKTTRILLGDDIYRPACDPCFEEHLERTIDRDCISPK